VQLAYCAISLARPGACSRLARARQRLCTRYLRLLGEAQRGAGQEGDAGVAAAAHPGLPVTCDLSDDTKLTLRLRRHRSLCEKRVNNMRSTSAYLLSAALLAAPAHASRCVRRP